MQAQRSRVCVAMFVTALLAVGVLILTGTHGHLAWGMWALLLATVLGVLATAIVTPRAGHAARWPGLHDRYAAVLPVTLVLLPCASTAVVISTLWPQL